MGNAVKAIKVTN